MNTPPWLDTTLYPFSVHEWKTPEGTMRYVDEGRGPQTIVLVHGTPTWSFMYRDLIAALSTQYRVVVPDHLGFGLSDKPGDGAYRPADHARRLSAFIEHLGLKDIALGVHDFGGPIGLSYAVAHPDNVKKLILFNTWMWSLADDPSIVKGSRMLGGGLGRFLYRWLNASPRFLLTSMWKNTATLTPHIHQHYLKAFGTRDERVAPWVFARELIGSGDWYDALWQRRDRIQDTPALLAWGMRDPGFNERYLERWQGALPHAEVARFADAGHFVPEEAGAEVIQRVNAFLKAGPPTQTLS